MKPHKLVMVFFAFLFTSCGYYKHVDPQVYTYDSEKLRDESAKLEARDKGGFLLLVTGKSSMEPVIYAGDLLVCVKTEFSDKLKGKVVSYCPKWNQRQNTTHRLVSGDAKNGFIASGDSNPKSEAFERVRAENFVGEVISIYRTEVIR